MRQIDKAIRENEDAVPCSKPGLGGQQIKGWQCPRGERSDNGFMAVQRMRGQVRVTDTLKGVTTGESMKRVNSGQCYHVCQISSPSRLGILSWANETVQSETSPEGRRAELSHRSGSQARGCGVSPGPVTDVTARHGVDALAIPHQGWHHQQRPGLKKSEASLGDLEVEQGAPGRRRRASRKWWVILSLHGVRWVVLSCGPSQGRSCMFTGLQGHTASMGIDGARRRAILTLKWNQGVVWDVCSDSGQNTANWESA